MENNVKKEFELYEPMRIWLHDYLTDKYKGFEVITIDSHSRDLYLFLEENGVIDLYPQTIGLDIQIDVLGIVKKNKDCFIVFIEAKKTPLNLHDLGQLWAYCKLCDPLEAFLFSSNGIGSLSKIFNVFHREDLLDFGNGKTIKKMRIAKWDVLRQSPESLTMIPKI